MKQIRIVFIVLFILVASGIFASGSEEKTSVSVSASGLTAPGTFPIVSNKAELKIFVVFGPDVENMDTNQFTDYYEKKTNVHVVWDKIPRNIVQEKMGVTLASGAYPDVFMGTPITKSTLYIYAKQGIVVPLNKAIENQGVNIKLAFTKDPDTKDSVVAPDKNIYALPKVGICYHCYAGQKLFIYTPWLEKLGLKMPTTTEEFKNVLKAFKTKDPNGNGKADEIPLAGSGNTWNAIYINLMNSFNYYDSTNLYLENKKILFAPVQAKFREGLRYLNSLYAEGLITQDSFTQNDQQFKQMGMNPDTIIVGAATALHRGSFLQLGDPRYEQYNAVSPLKGPNGLQQTPYMPSNPSMGFVATSALKNLDLFVRWADWFYSFEGAVSSFIGPKGIGWDDPTPGTKTYTGVEGKHRRLRGYGIPVQNIGWQSAAVTFRDWDIIQTEVPFEPVSGYNNEAYLYEITNKLYMPYSVKKNVPDLYYEEQEATIVAGLKTTIDDYVKLSIARFITGEISLESAWDSYIAEFDKMGLPSYMKTIQAVYDKKYK